MTVICWLDYDFGTFRQDNSMQPAPSLPVERFDELFQGAPAEIEPRLSSLRPLAAIHPDASLAPQIESQIALVQGMQQRWEEAFATLDRAEQLPGAEVPLARVRLLLERGRVYHQARRMAEAMPWMIASYELSQANRLDYHAINAAHMVAIVAEDVATKIHWNAIAIQLTESTTDEKAKTWQIVLQNNIGQAYIAAGQYQNALIAFECCRHLAFQQGNALVERGARWGIARAKRSLGEVGEALSIQQQLLEEYNTIEREGSLPGELIGMARGMVYEELAELSPDQAAEYATKALQDLGVNTWFHDLEPVRWMRLQRLASEPNG